MIKGGLAILILGICLYFLGVSLSKKEHSYENKKNLADYHGEMTVGGLFLIVLGFVSVCVWFVLNFIVAKR